MHACIFFYNTASSGPGPRVTHCVTRTSASLLMPSDWVWAPYSTPGTIQGGGEEEVEELDEEEVDEEEMNERRSGPHQARKQSPSRQSHLPGRPLTWLHGATFETVFGAVVSEQHSKA